MAMNVGSSSGTKDPEVMMDINTTPMIDVMLVLLIMLIITIPIQTHAVRLELPRTEQQPVAARLEGVRLVVASDGAMSWNGAAVPDRAALEQRLRGAAAQQLQPEIHLLPD